MQIPIKSSLASPSLDLQADKHDYIMCEQAHLFDEIEAPRIRLCSCGKASDQRFASVLSNPHGLTAVYYLSRVTHLDTMLLAHDARLGHATSIQCSLLGMFTIIHDCHSGFVGREKGESPVELLQFNRVSFELALAIFPNSLLFYRSRFRARRSASDT